MVSAVQGGRETVVDGQPTLACAAQEQGAWRIVPSDFALDLFAATRALTARAGQGRP